MMTPFANYDEGCIRLIVQHRKVFGAWSVVNIIAGAISLAFSGDAVWYFGLMCLSWGAINLIVWLLLFVHTREKRFLGEGMDGRRWVQRHIEFMFLFNVGLDLLYIASGVYLFYTAATAEPEIMYHSFAYAVGVQGVYLCAQDTAFWALHRRNFRKRWVDSPTPS